MDRLIHEVSDQFVIHGFLDCIMSDQIARQYEGSMGTVEDADLPLLVWLLVVGEDDVHVGLALQGLIQRKLFTDVFR